MLASTPPMGWNSWNTFGADVNAAILMETADALVSSGLRDAGYVYLVVDDFWEAPERVDGRLTWDPDRFPAGLPAVIDYVHSQGLKFGIYSCAGSHTCGGRPASYGYEEVDAQTFAAWGVDFLKYDFCFVPAGHHWAQALSAHGAGAARQRARHSFQPLRMGAQQAVAVGGRCRRPYVAHHRRHRGQLGFYRRHRLQPPDGAGGLRRSGPLERPRHAGRGHVRQGQRGQGDGGCTNAEYRSHFSLWSLLAAPLMIGCDVRSMDEMTRTILAHDEVIAVNQDVLGSQGYCVGQTMHGGGLATVYARPLADGDIAVGLFNLGDHNQQPIPLGWETLGLHPQRSCRVRDLWARSDLGRFRGTLALPVDSHDVALLRLSPE